jgi:hypothetical protein
MSNGLALPADVWDSLPPEVRALIEALRADVGELQLQLRTLQQRVQDLQARLNADSH